LVQFLPLLAAAALVGILHMSAPDHWVTLCILGQRAAWSRGRLVGFGIATAGGHVLLSVVLGFAIVAVGLAFSQEMSNKVTLATGFLMLVIGGGYGVKKLLAIDSEDYDKDADQELIKARTSGRGLPYFVVLGGALSPDLSILPVFLLAIPAGLGLVLDTALVFALASVLSLTALALLGSMGLAKALSHSPAKYNDSLVGFVIAAVGAYVIVFG
jgi:nickel/cobalt transporter (NicO) family protein